MRVKAQQREAERFLQVADMLEARTRRIEGLSVDDQVFLISMIGGMRAAARVLGEAAELFIQTHMMLTGREPPEDPPSLRIIDGGGDDLPPDPPAA